MIDKNICNICGGNYVPKNGRWVCEACGAFKPEEINNEELTLIYRAEEEIRCTNFEDAEDTFSHVIELYPDDSEGYWGYLRAHYGIKYERDYNGKTIPSCYNACYESFLQHPYYQKALQKADSKQKIYYEREAARIDAIREEWIKKAEQEPEYDVFLSYKDSESGPEGNKTDDYNKVYEIYNHLTSLGYHVFFAPKSLSGKAGEKNYEPYIFRALNTAHVMIVYASKPEYLNATWVKNEWSRFLKRIERGEKAQNALAVAFSGFNASELPRPLNTIQNFDASAFSFAPELERYVESVVSQARMTMPRISRISLSSRSMPKAKTLSGAKLQKVGLSSVQKSKEKIIKATVESRKFGLETTPTLTGDVSNRLIVAGEYVKRRQFQEAKDILDPILANDKWNGRALLLKMLADSNSTSIGTFVKQIDTFQDFPLLESVINYGERSVSEDLLQKIASAILNLFNTGEYETSLRLYKQIASYDSPTLLSLHKAIVEQAITLLGSYRKNVFEHLDLGLLYLRVDEQEFKLQLQNTITTLLANEDFTDAGKYLIEYKESFGEDRFYLVQDFLKNSAAPTFEKALSAPNDLMAERLTKTMESMTKSDADSLLCNIANSCSTLFKNNDFETASFWVSFLKPYEFSMRGEFQKDGIEYLTNNISPDNYILFKLLLSYYGTGQEETFLDAYEKYTNRLMHHHYYAAAVEAYTDLLEYSPKSEAVLYSRILAICKCQAPENLKDNIGQLAIKNDFGPIEAYLTVDGDKDNFLRRLNELASVALAGFSDESSVNALKVFERLSSYYPKSADSKLADEFERIAQISQKRNLYDIAVKYYSLAIGLGKGGHETYWRLLQSKLHCKDDAELVVCKTPIASFPEFNNAIVAAGSNQDVVSHYIDCRINQEQRIAHGQKTKKRRKMAGIFAGLLTILVMISVTIAVLTDKVFIPASKYSDAVSLINGGYYDEALEKLDGLSYADSQNQITVAKAGLAFKRGDYLSGIDRIYDVNGTVVIDYDLDGGMIRQSKTKRLVNQPNVEGKTITKDGYNFAGWKQTDYSLQTSKGHYSVDLDLKASYQAITYYVVYKLDGGFLANPVKAYNVLSEDITLGTPTKTGYEFVGWSGTEIEGTQKTVTIPSGSIGDRTYTAHWSAAEYTIHYDYGYGDGGSQKVTYDQEYRLEQPERLGYRFLGWQKEGKPFNEGTWNYEGDVDLVAQWAPISYSITYDLDEGINSPNNPEVYTIESNDVVLEEPVKQGYTFTGWTGGEYLTLTKKATIRNGSTGNRTFKAHWTANEYLVQYDYGYDNKTSSQKVTYGSSFELENPTRNGYAFLGWYDGDNKVENGTWNQTSGMNLSAMWSINNYVIAYELGGGMNHPSNPSTYTVETPTFELFEPTRTGYEFLGWTKGASKTPKKEQSIPCGSTGDVTFTAHWKAKEYSITFDYRGGTEEILQTSISYDSEFQLPSNTAKLGYTFAGWYDVATNALIQTTKWTWDHDLSVYAKWVPTSYAITYVLNGGTNANQNPVTYTTESQEITISDPTKPGYTFQGWNVESGETRYSPTIPSGSTGDRKFEACWQANRNTVVLHGNNATTGEMSSIQANTDQVVTLPSNVYKRNGYQFAGWSYSPNGAAVYADGGDMKVGTSSLIDLYACWKPNSNALVFHSNGGTGTMEKQYMHTDETGDLNVNSFTREGYHFTGWSTTSDGIPSHSDGSKYTMGADAETNLYAIWEPNVYTITLDANKGNCDSEIQVKYDSEYTLPKPTRDGYSFAGWYHGEEQFSDASAAPLKKYGVVGDITLTAHWTPKLNVVLLTDGTNVIQVKANSDSYVRLPANTFTKDGFLFDGWATTQDGEVAFQDKDLYYVGTKSSYTLFAVFTDASGYVSISSKRDVLNMLKSDYVSKNYYLNCDIDMEGELLCNKTYFRGVFDGRGHSIYNYKVGYREWLYESISSWREYFSGIFFSNSGTIKNLNVYDVSYDVGGVPGRYDLSSVSITCYMGSICGQNKGIMENCHADVEAVINFYNNTYYIGGVIGRNESDLKNITANVALSLLTQKYYESRVTITGVAGEWSGSKEKSIRCEGCAVQVTFTTPDRSAFLHLDAYAVGMSYTIAATDCAYSSDLKDYSGFLKSETPAIESKFRYIKFVIEGHVYYSLRKSFETKKQMVFKTRKNGYTLIGWSLSEDGPLAYTIDDEIGLSQYQNGLTLYAKWQKNTNAIVFDGNGSTDGAMDELKWKTDDQETLPVCQYVKDGYHFAGWSLTANGEKVYDDGQSITVPPDSKLTLYALWEPDENTITFHANGGSGTMENQKGLSDSTFALSKCGFIAPDGYYFAGWALSPDGDSVFADGASFTMNTAKTYDLYARWLPIE